MACQSGSDAGEKRTKDADSPPVVEITAADYAFAAPDTIPSGWVTFRMENRGAESHHFHFTQLAEGWTVAEWREVAKEPLDSLIQLRRKGKIDSAETIRAYRKAIAQSTADSVTSPADLYRQTRGGVGLVTPGRTGQTTHRVEPGHYVMICVIRTSSGRSHAGLGMMRGIVATGSSIGRSPPEADLTMRASGRELAVEGEFEEGENTVRFVVDSIPDVPDSTRTAWLASLDSTTSAEDLANWIVKSGRTPPPAPFVGGFEYYPASDPIYFTVDLEPGRHVLLWGYRGGTPETREFTVE
jgi:hypothetical protein